MSETHKREGKKKFLRQKLSLPPDQTITDDDDEYTLQIYLITKMALLKPLTQQE